MLGHNVDETLVDTFLAAPEVQSCFPGGKVPQMACHCFPRLNVRPPAQPYADRLVWIGDGGVARLVFLSTTLIQKLRPLRHGVLRMTATEQADREKFHHMSSVLWVV